MLNQFSLLLIIVPAGVAFINLFLPTLLRKLLSFLCLSFLMYLLVDAYFITQLFETGKAGHFELFGQTVFEVDKVAMFALFFIQLLSFLILIFSLNGVLKDIEKAFFVLYPLTVAMCNGVVLSAHAISFMIFWGASGITLFLYALLGRTKNSTQTARKTIMIVGGSDALLIMGFVLLLTLKSTSGWALPGLQLPLDSLLSYLAFILLIIAAFAKAGGFPMHTWVPDFAEDAPVESAALLPASLDKLLGIYLLARIMTTLFIVNLTVHLIVVTFGALTVITAVMMAMIQHNGRRLLGYHAVSQVGYMIMGVASGQIIAFAGGLFHLVNHTIYKSNLFLSLGAVEKKTGTNDLNELGGLARNMPIIFIMALIGALSISGIPPFNGFFSKWMIYQGILEIAKNTTPGFQMWILVCLILAVFGSALTLASFMKFIHSIFLGKRPDRHQNIKEAPFNQWLATGLLSLLCVLFGIAAVGLPLKFFIYPALLESGFAIPEFTGLYNPVMLVLLFGFAFIIGIIIYLLTRKVRFDSIYLGGMSPLEKFRVSGTAFYNEIRSMRPLKGIYNAAEKKVFDVYDVCSKGSTGLAKALQLAHSGLLSLYVFFIVIGVLIFLAVL